MTSGDDVRDAFALFIRASDHTRRNDAAICRPRHHPGSWRIEKISNLGLLVVAGFVFLFLLWRETRQGGKATRPSDTEIVSVSPRHLVFGMLLAPAPLLPLPSGGMFELDALR